MQPLQLAIPEFIYNNEPTLVPGGGAEIIPLANPAWFANNGFSQSFSWVFKFSAGIDILSLQLDLRQPSMHLRIPWNIRTTDNRMRKVVRYHLVLI